MRNFGLGCVVMVVVSACGPAARLPAPKIEETTFDASLNIDLSASTKLANGEYVRDLTVGDGAIVALGQAINARYTGWLPTGVQFDSNGAAAQAFTFRYGTGEVIKGWDQGFDGVKVGGTRQLIIPPDLGYGVPGAPPAIPSNSILVFSVTLQ